MSEKYKIFDDGLYFCTLTTVGWIDVFTRAEYCNELIKNLNYCIDNKNLKIYAFCIMPSHVHFIGKVEGGNLSDALRDFKSYTSKKIIQMIKDCQTESKKEWLLNMFKDFGNRNAHNETYQFWQQNNHAFDLFSSKLIMQKMNYIHDNPVKARMVSEAQHYIYSSANPFTELKLSKM